MKSLRFLQGAANVWGATLFLGMFFTFVVQIAARFAFNRPLPWTDELAVVLYIWIVLFGAATMVRQRDHVMFDVLYAALPLRVQRLMDIAGALLVGGFAAWAMPACLDYVVFMGREQSPVLGWPLSWVFLPFLFLLSAMVLRSAWQLTTAVRKCAELRP